MVSENSEARECANTNRASIENNRIGNIDMTSLTLAPKNCTINVPFHGSELYVVNHNGEPFIPMKPIVEGMGMAWQTQHRKLTDRFKTGITEMVIPSVGGAQKMLCLALRKLAAWLNTISPNKVKPEIRERVIRYQEECDDVLYEYWTKGQVTNPRKTSTDERTPLRDAINMLVGKRGIMYPEAYSYVHQRFNVGHIDQIESAQLPAAIEYVHRLALEGELLPKEPQFLPVANQFTDAELCDLAWLWRAGLDMINACRSVTPLLEVAQHRLAGQFVSIGLNHDRVLEKARKAINRETAHIKYEPWNDDSWSRVLPHLRQESIKH